jgi:hypothetical protein
VLELANYFLGRHRATHERAVSLTAPVTGRPTINAVTDKDWMRWDHKAPPASPSPREEVFGFAVMKDGRTMTGLLRRVDDERWEATYLIKWGALHDADARQQ